MIYNIDFLISGIIFLLVIMYYFMLQRTMDFGHNKSFMWLLIMSILNLSLDLICTILISGANPLLAHLTEVCLVLLYMLQVLVPALLLYHIMSQFSLEPRYKFMRLITASLLAIMLILLILNHWTGFFFSVDELGIYTRGPLYMLMYIFAGIYLFATSVCSKIHEAELTKAKTRAIYELIIIAGIFVLIQSLMKDVLVSGFGIAIGITILFFTLDNPYHYTDSLTSTFDSSYFKDRSQYKIDNHGSFNILALKLNQMKRLNLIMGTETGNELLIKTSNILKSGSKRNLVFRLSGNQFAIMTVTNGEQNLMYERVKSFFLKPVQLSTKEVSAPAVICSIKNAEKLGNADNLISYIDYLMRIPEQGSGTSLVEENEETLKGFRKNQEIESFLDTALKEDLFKINYQPIYSVSQKKYIGFEVLSRLHHPSLGWISPNLFITMAEKSGQISQIGLKQLRKVCIFLQNNPKLVDSIENVKVNLSPAEFVKEGYVNMILDVIREYKLPVSMFQFEITETVATEYSEILHQLIDSFREAGIKLCMDDFGSGYSNLNAVMKVPFSVIKLDRSLLFGICDNERIAALYQSMITTFHNLGYQVVSEGVETEQEARLVSEWGTDMIQGYYYSKPLSDTELLKLFAE